ncbi:putative baseplate assembly protein [Dactylosporangium sp. NPDC051485]|uniref:putative baseplate assembly protein n=1 Tax=Dactylosporangium sp. NPDC051485 TaxID=3154846 RepID=UPI00343DC624
MDAPLVDPRSGDDLARRTTELAAHYSGWTPPGPGAAPDPGTALIGVFSRFAQLVVDHLNQAPMRNFVSFLNLIGTQPRPPRPAQVPLTFTLASGTTAGVLVPAGTPVATGDEVGFATDADLTVSPANLVAVFVGDPVGDRFSDRTATAGPFPAFTGDRPVPHDLLIGVAPTKEAGPLTIRLTTSDAPIWHNGSLVWSAWDGTRWVPVPAAVSVHGGDVVVALDAVAPLPSLTVAAVSAGWVRASLAHGLPAGDAGQPPESIAVGARSPQDFAPGVAPFGDTGQVRRFYLSVDQALAPGGALAHLHVSLSTPGRAGPSPTRLNWAYKLGNDWVPLGTATSADDGSSAGTGFRDGTFAFSRDGVIDFVTPATWPVALYRTRLGRWLRIEIDGGGGDYTTPPVIGSVVVDSEWDLPRLDAVHIAGDPGPPAVPVTTIALNGAPLDSSRPFWPFGTQPAFGDTLEISCPTGLAAPLTLEASLVNPINGSGAPVPAVQDRPAIAWDGFDGTTWTPMTADAGAFFSTGGRVTLTPAAGVAAIAKVRARLAGPGYGSPARYVQASDGGYVLQPATLAPPVVQTLSWLPGARPDAAPVALVTSDDRGHVVRTGGFAPFEPVEDDEPALYLGFDRAPGPSPVTLYLAVADPDPAEVSADQLAGLDPQTAAHVRWDYLSPAGWAPLLVEDGTATLSASGVVRFLPPADLTLAPHFGVTAAWVRLRWQSGYFPVTPRLAAVLANTVTATQATSVTAEVLGSGNGGPGQVLTTTQSPVLPGARLEIRASDGTWATWQQVSDFYDSGPTDRHYTLDPLTGAVTFGDGTAGALPPVAPSNVRISYHTGGGPGGNQPAGAVTTLKVALPSVDSVTNHMPAEGGAAEESLHDVIARGPLVLRHRERAVTAQDVEDLAREASTEVARVKAVVPTQFDPLALWMDPDHPVLLPGHSSADAGQWGVIVVPDSAVARPAPGYGLLSQVRAYLRARCAATVQPWVAGPEWIGATVAATVVPVDAGAADQTRDAVVAALSAFLHPLTGGPDGAGWAFGRKPHQSEIYAVAERVPGVDHVKNLTLTLTPEAPGLADRVSQVLDRSITHAADPVAADIAQWLDRALVHSGEHTVTMSLER